MKKNGLLLAAVLLAAILIVGLAPAALRSLPTRYAVRLPQPLQALALPADTTPLLPTAVAPRSATNLLNDGLKPPVVTMIETPAGIPVTVSTNEDAPPSGADAPSLTATSSPVPSPEPSPTPWPVPASVRLNGFTHVYQEWNNCGPATMVMALTYFGQVHSQRDTARAIRPNPEDRNVTPHEMADFANSVGGLRSIARVNGDLTLLKRFLANGIPVIIEIGFDPPGEYRWLGWYGHYLLPVAYDDTTNQVWVYDSWLGTSEVPQTNADPNGRVLTYDELDGYWSEFNWSFIALYEPQQEQLIGELLSSSLIDDTMWRASLQRAQSLAATNPDNAFYWFNLGTSYNALGEYDKAAIAFDQARAIGLPWRMLWYQFGPYEAYYQTGRYEDVVLLAETTLKDRPYFEESLYYLGLAQNALGDTMSARKNLEAAVAFNPNFTPASQALSALFPPNG